MATFLFLVVMQIWALIPISLCWSVAVKYKLKPSLKAVVRAKSIYIEN